MERQARIASLGFRVRTGRATVVALEGPPDPPRILWRRDIALCDPRVEESREPFHPALVLEGARADKIVKRAVEAATRAGRRAVSDPVADLRAGGFQCLRAALVVGSLSDPARIGNPHVRAHAAEGRLFREIVETGLSACGVASFTITQKSLSREAAAALGLGESEISEVLRGLRRCAGRPFRAEHKQAALAAWMALATSSEGRISMRGVAPREAADETD